jgi:NADH:ubiquinone reductase (H+-translocating)
MRPRLSIESMSETKRHRVLVLGGGFGGLTFARAFNCTRAEVTLLDQCNHHLFQPLLYQVATASLAAPNIAQPLRSLFPLKSGVEVKMEEVRRIDLARRTVFSAVQAFSYDTLILALGSTTNYFGHPEWSEHAIGLKNLADAHRIRNQLLGSFETAENGTHSEAGQRKLMTCVVIGAGPTGVEMAGAMADLTKRVFRRDFRHINPSRARIVLVDAIPRVLAGFPESLSESARRQLESLGVEVITDRMVRDIRHGEVHLPDRVIEANTIIWTAGVSAHPLTRQLDVPRTRGGQIEVNPDCSLPGHPEVFAIGDIASLRDTEGNIVPGIAPGAMQMARHVARLLERELMADSPPPRPPFRYKDKGLLATIGRRRAVARLGKREFSGYSAWLLWLGIHLVFLVGMRNRLLVLLQWFYAYVRNQAGARVIWHPHRKDARAAAEDNAEAGG